MDRDKQDEASLCGLFTGPKANGNLTKTEHCQTMTMTLVINFCFLVLGICEAIKGPTLLDLQDIYEVELDVISFLFAVECFGSLAGSFSTGYLMTTFPEKQSLILFTQVSLLGLSTSLTPFAPTLGLFFFLLFFVGFLVAAVHTGGNILCLNLWSGSDYCGPHIHAIHFCYSFGSFLSPVLAAPFLETETKSSSITTLFPLIGLATILVSYGFLHFWFEQRCKGYQLKMGYETVQETQQTEKTGNFYGFATSFTVFLFLYVGIEYCFGTYLTEFAVNCSLNLSRSQGAMVTAIFWGSFSAMRFLAIFASLKVDPALVLSFSFVICMIGSVAMLFLAQHSLLALNLCSAVLGFGMGTVFATGLAWVEQRVAMDNDLSATLVIAGTIGPDIFPVLIGQFLEKMPMILVYAEFATVITSIALFFVTMAFVKRLKR